jgi:hypothetical protein
LSELHLVTEQSLDDYFSNPVIDVDEMREGPEPHRYIHGHFDGTPGRFSFYFPDKARYEGRFFHNTYPLIADADAGMSPIDFKVSEGDIGFAFASGGYFVQTNQGAGAMQREQDPTLSSSYRLNAAAAKFSRKVAKDLYGEGRRPYGYIYGGSGGSLQVMGCAENTSGVWDGFLPFVLGTPYALAHMPNVAAHAHRALSRRNKLPEIVDALAPGGSGDPYATLNEEESAALKEASLMGFPLHGWWQHEMIGRSSIGSADAFDPSFTEDFWSKPGYLGTDPQSSIAEDRFEFETTIAGITPGLPAMVELTSAPDRDISRAQFFMTSGASAGKPLPVFTAQGKVLTMGVNAGLGGLPGAFLPFPPPEISVGDTVRVDNSGALAFETYCRHFLPPSPEYYGWNQFRDEAGQPLYPQRPTPATPGVRPVGSTLEGRVTGKVLVMECALDIHAWPWQADWYRSKIKEALGESAGHAAFALWYIDNSSHDSPGHFGTQGYKAAAWARTICPIGVLEQGLRDLAAWCEQGTRPLETRYTIVDTQLQLPESASERGGVQPVVTLQANGGERAEVKVGQPVKFSGMIEVPPNAGKAIAVAWDCEGRGEPEGRAPQPLADPSPQIEVSTEHAYAKPGTYFPLLRAFSHRDGDPAARYGLVQNLARARVVVT